MGASSEQIGAEESEPTEVALALATRSIRDARLNWHPQVHQHFDEDLYFVLLRFARPRDVAKAIDALMRDAGIQSYCGYTVFGWFDGLVRFWLTPQHWQRFLRVLSRHEGEIPENRHLKVATLRYLWSPNRDDPLMDPRGPGEEMIEAIERERKQVLEVAEQPGAPPTAAVAELEGKGLLLPKPREDWALFKVVTVLQLAGSAGDMGRVAAEISQALLSDPLFGGGSVYSGDGTLGSHLVRMTVRKYEDVLALTEKLDKCVANMPIRTMTLLIANPEPVESDNINNVRNITPAEHRTARLLNVDVDAIALLDPTSRAVLDQLTRELAESLAGSTEWFTAQGVLAACVTGDRRAIRQHLSFVLDFEFYFRSYVAIVLAECYSDGWEEAVVTEFPTIFRNLSEEDRHDPEKWPLGVAFRVLREAVAGHSLARARVLRELGEDWNSTVRDVLNLRNPFAHGRLLRSIDRLDDLSGEWGKQLTTLLRALPAYRALYHCVEGSME